MLFGGDPPYPPGPGDPHGVSIGPRQWLDRELSPGENSRDITVAAGEVLVIAGVAPPGFLAEDPVHGRALLPAVLDRDQASGPQQAPRDPLDRPHRVQAVGAAPQRRRRVVL